MVFSFLFCYLVVRLSACCARASRKTKHERPNIQRTLASLNKKESTHKNQQSFFMSVANGYLRVNVGYLRKEGRPNIINASLLRAKRLNR
jgi:hypothetical protein